MRPASLAGKVILNDKIPKLTLMFLSFHRQARSYAWKVSKIKICTQNFVFLGYTMLPTLANYTLGDFIFPSEECLKLSLNGNESFSAN